MKPTRKVKIQLLCIYASINFVLIPAKVITAENFPERVKRTVSDTLVIRQEKQKTEDKWVLEKEKLAARYDALTLKRENLQAAGEQLKQNIVFKENNIQSLKQQLSDISHISDETIPFLNEVFGRLKGLIDGGLPFLEEERTTRIEKLGVMLEDPDVTVSEKFRKLMEAVQIEAEYGNTIEVYPQQIILDGKEIQTHIFRLGRISLFCQSLDQKTCGFFDLSENQWKILPKKYNRDIHTAIEIGSKRRPADLVDLPLGRISKK